MHALRSEQPTPAPARTDRGRDGGLTGSRTHTHTHTQLLVIEATIRTNEARPNTERRAISQKQRRAPHSTQRHAPGPVHRFSFFHMNVCFFPKYLSRFLAFSSTRKHAPKAGAVQGTCARTSNNNSMKFEIKSTRLRRGARSRLPLSLSVCGEPLPTLSLCAFWAQCATEGRHVRGEADGDRQPTWASQR